MTNLEFLTYLRDRDIKLWIDGEKLRYSSPTGALTPDLRAELTRRKVEIIMFLRSTCVNSQLIPSVLRDKDLPLSFPQQRLWFIDQLVSGSPTYNIPRAVRLTGSLDVASLEQSLNEIVQRHETLRTAFPAVDGEPIQVIVPTLTLALPIVDLQDMQETCQELEIRRLVIEEVNRPFDLAQGPLIRLSLLRMGEEEHVLLLVIHHIIFDGWSLGIFYKELSVLYTAFSMGKPSPLPDLPVQYADFAVWQRQWLQGEVLEKQLSYWKQKLADPPVLELPTDRPRSAVQTFQGARQSLTLPKILAEKLRALSQQEGVTLFMMLLAVFKILLYRYTGQDDVILGSPIAHRKQTEIEGLIGFFVDTLVLRTDLSGNPTFRELLEQVREVTLGAYAHQDLPFEKLVEELQLERYASPSPLFHVMFVLNNLPKQTLELPGITSSALEVHSGMVNFDLILSMFENAEGLGGSVKYNTVLFDSARIKRMLMHFQTLLENIVFDPEQRIEEILLTIEAEWQQFMEWNDAQRDYPGDICVHQLFEAQVVRTPDAIAVIFDDQQLTYRKLKARTNQIAYYLKKHGVGPEVLVGIAVESSLEMVIGLMGILKTGDAYVPLDPTYPKERLAFMLDDTHWPVLLTKQNLVEALTEHGANVVWLDYPNPIETIIGKFILRIILAEQH